MDNGVAGQGLKIDRSRWQSGVDSARSAPCRSDAKAATVKAAANAAGVVSVQTVLLDVTNALRCAEVVDEVRPWAFVNNAGYSGVGAIEDVSDEEQGGFRLTRAPTTIRS